MSVLCVSVRVFMFYFASYSHCCLCFFLFSGLVWPTNESVIDHKQLRSYSIGCLMIFVCIPSTTEQRDTFFSSFIAIHLFREYQLKVLVFVRSCTVFFRLLIAFLGAHLFLEHELLNLYIESNVI